MSFIESHEIKFKSFSDSFANMRKTIEEWEAKIKDALTSGTNLERTVKEMRAMSRVLNSLADDMAWRNDDIQGRFK